MGDLRKNRAKLLFTPKWRRRFIVRDRSLVPSNEIRGQVAYDCFFLDLIANWFQLSVD